GHTPGHSVVRLASGGDRLTFAGAAEFQVAFEHPVWFNGFEHDPEEAARVRIRLLRELASTGEALIATHLPFPSVCHVAHAGNAFGAYRPSGITERIRQGRLGEGQQSRLGQGPRPASADFPVARARRREGPRSSRSTAGCSRR